MGVIVNMIFAVAVVAAAAGAVTEFQFRIAYIRAAADGAFVGVGRFGLCCGCLIRTCMREGDDLRFFLLGCVGFLAEKPPCIGTPGHGNHIQNVGATPAAMKTSISHITVRLSMHT